MLLPSNGRLPCMVLRESNGSGMDTRFKMLQASERSREREGAGLEKEVSNLFLEITMVQSKSSDRPGRELGSHVVPPGTSDRSMIGEFVPTNNQRTLDMVVELKR